MDDETDLYTLVRVHPEGMAALERDADPIARVALRIVQIVIRSAYRDPDDCCCGLCKRRLPTLGMIDAVAVAVPHDLSTSPRRAAAVLLCAACNEQTWTVQSPRLLKAMHLTNAYELTNYHHAPG